MCDPLICLLFEFVLEIKVESQDRVINDTVTVATFPYMPKITRSKLHPVEIVDDFILETRPISKASKLCPTSQLVHVMQGYEQSSICLEGIVSENEKIG